MKITLNSIKPTVVDDFGNEELYGSVSVGTIGKLYSGNTSLLNIANSAFVSAGTNTNIVTSSPSPNVVFNLNQATTTASTVTFTIDIKDKIMPCQILSGLVQATRQKKRWICSLCKSFYKHKNIYRLSR